MTIAEVLLRLMTSLVLGGIVGYEREERNKAAGLRTHILVSMGACLCMMVSLTIPLEMQRTLGLSADGGRIAAQVVSGVGFLGAGTILTAQRGRKIQGLTTAASIWAVAAVGLAAGAGLYAMAVLTGFFILVTLKTLRHIDEWLSRRRPPELLELVLTVDASKFSMPRLHLYFREHRLRLVSFTTDRLSPARAELRLLLEDEESGEPDDLILDMMALPGTEQASAARHTFSDKK